MGETRSIANIQHLPHSATPVTGGLEIMGEHDARQAKLRRGRDSGIWYAGAGVALLFAGSISTALAIGGVLMVTYGAIRYITGSIQLARFEDDPWKDPELDAWEETHYGDGDEIEGESIVNDSPDSAWGGGPGR